MTPGETQGSTPKDAVAAFIVRVNFEDWDPVRKAVAESGGRVVYQKLAPPWTRFEVVERTASEV